MRIIYLLGALLLGGSTGRGTTLAAQDSWVVYPGGEGAGRGKHVVLLSGDEEYRSEEALPQLGKILSQRHGFKCTVLFAINRKTGDIDPTTPDNIPGLEALDTADLLVVFLRFRSLPDLQMKHVVDYVESGKPIVGMRTATHAFNFGKDSASAYKKYGWTWGEKDYEKGFGRQVLGETWVNHHGAHGKQSTRGVIAESAKNHPIVRGCEDIWGPTDVYSVNKLEGDAVPLVMGQVLQGMKPTDPPLEGPKNNPMMPVAWTKTYRGEKGIAARVFTTTMGASQDLRSEGLRRLLVNAAFWALGLEEKIAPRTNVDLVGPYEPLPFGFGGFKKGVKPSDHRLE